MLYLISCKDAKAEDIIAMQEQAKEVTYRTFVQYANYVDLWAQHMGYFKKYKGLTLRNDRMVKFFKSMYRGSACVFLVHSRIEHIWLGKVDSRRKWI